MIKIIEYFVVKLSPLFSPHIAFITVFASQMTLLEFFCDSSILPPPLRVIKQAESCASMHFVRESANSGKKKERRKKKKPTGKTLSWGWDLNPWTLSAEPSSLITRPQQPAF